MNVGSGAYNFTAGTHTLEIIIKGENAPHINEIRLNVQQYGSWAADGIVLGDETPVETQSELLSEILLVPEDAVKMTAQYALPVSALR